MSNRFFNNIIDLFSGSKAKASDLEAHFTLITTGFDTVQDEMDLKAPAASPNLTGTPAAPTAAPGTNTIQIATTAYTTEAVAAEAVLRTAADDLEIATRLAADTLETSTRITNDNLEIAARIAADALKAPLASPDLTGVPTAPTAAAGSSTNQIATTEFVTATAFVAIIPGQTGNAGKYLTTDGTNATWIDIPTAPPQLPSFNSGTI